MSKTLLEITQEILSVMTSDEVNSITDSAEAESVARIVVSTFEAMTSNRNWPHLKKLFKLTGFGNSEQPTHLTLPDDIKELLFIKYNKTKLGDARLRYDKIIWKEPDEFLVYVNNRNSTSSNVKTVVDPTGIQLMVLTDVHPRYYTSFNDETIVMDSYDSSVDTTLHAYNVQAFGYYMPTTSFVDGWEPDLPREAMKSLVEEAKSVARFQIDTVNDIKAEQESNRQQRWLSRKAWSVKGGIKYPNYGRSSRKSRRDVTFDRNN